MEVEQGKNPSGGAGRGPQGMTTTTNTTGPPSTVNRGVSSVEGGVGDCSGGGGGDGGAGTGFVASPPPTAAKTTTTNAAAAAAGLVFSGKWTHEPLYGGAATTATGSRGRSSARGSGGGGGDDCVGEGQRAGRGGEVDVGLVKRSMEIRVGRLELWPDPPVLGRISHLVR